MKPTVDYDKLQRALWHLQRQYTNHQVTAGRAELTEIDREAIAESVIQRFETCYDSLWKTLKQYLIHELGLPEVPNSPKPILKLAAQNNLLGVPVERWLGYADARTDTAHDYSGEKAGRALLLIGSFIEDAAVLSEKMTGSRWA